MHRVAVISDTHGLLRPEIIEKIQSCEVILHAGDIDNQEVIEKLQQIAPLSVVRGNADKNWAESIPEELHFNLFGFQVYMVHNKKHITTDLSQTEIVVYGHSHKYEAKQTGDIFYLNPGSCGPRRFHQEITMAVLLIDEEKHSFSVEKVDCSPVLEKSKAKKLPQQDMHRLITQIRKDMVAGKTVSQIAKRNRVEEELVEQICRIISTHPGVDVDGVLNRMDIWGK